MSNSATIDREAAVSRVAIWDRTDIPTLNESGKVNRGYLETFIEAEKAATDEAIKAKCRERFYHHIRITMD